MNAAADELDAQADKEDEYVATALLVMAHLGGEKEREWDSYQQTVGTVNHSREVAARLRARAAELRQEASER